MDPLGVQAAVNQLMTRVEALEAKTAVQEHQQVAELIEAINDLKEWVAGLDIVINVRHG